MTDIQTDTPVELEYPSKIYKLTAWFARLQNRNDRKTKLITIFLLCFCSKVVWEDSS